MDFRDVRIAKISSQRNMAILVAIILMLVVTSNFFLHDKMLTNTRPGRRKYGRKYGKERRMFPGQYYSSVEKSAPQANFAHTRHSSSNAAGRIAHTARGAPELRSSRRQGMTGPYPSSNILLRGQECDLSAAAEPECSEAAPFSWDCSALVDNDLSTRWAALHRPSKASFMGFAGTQTHYHSSVPNQ